MYQTFYPEQRIEFYSLNNVSVLPNNMAYSVNSIRRTSNSTDLYGELLSPFENPEQKFRSRRRLFDTPSLVESNSSEFDHNYDIKEKSKEEVRETMTETMEQYMRRPEEITAASRWLRNQPSGSFTTWEVLKTKFLNKYCPPAHTAKKMEEINNFQQEPDESLFRAWEDLKDC
ncbi:retrotransposon protein [Tanacetum coccineum]